MNFINEYKYIIVPFATWFGIQLFKVIHELIKTKKLILKELWELEECQVHIVLLLHHLQH